SGPLILSWADIRADLASPFDGCCVAGHEMAHKIDALDGAMGGTPPLPRARQRAWAEDFPQAYDAPCRHVHTGAQTLLAPDATDAPGDLFAVAGEYHFSAPQLLAEAVPAVAAHLQRFYGDPPALAVSSR